MSALAIHEVVEFTIKQAEAERLKAFIDKRYEQSIDKKNRVDPMPKLEAMLIKNEQ